MKDITLGIGWYGMLLGIPLILLSLAVAGWITGPAWQRVMRQHNRTQR